MDDPKYISTITKSKLLPSVFFLVILHSYQLFSQTGWNQVNTFGTNQGNLNMFYYSPASLTSASSLVIVMHGCTQNAIQCANQTGWNKFADRNGFYVLYPEQKTINNSSNCFNWFNSADQERGQGEAASISEMISYMINNFNIDTNRIFVTGLSAGAAMSVVMMSAYPDVISKGAIMAGGPYKATTNVLGATAAMNGQVIKTPLQWGDLVRNTNPWYTGSFPTMAIFHGTSDPIVNINNADELVKQWTNVNGVDQIVDFTLNNFSGNSFVSKSVYQNVLQTTVVEKYLISGFGHAVALDTGSCSQQGGEVGNYAFDINFNAVYWAANFFGIINQPYQINGLINVTPSQSGIVYSVPTHAGSNYQWTVPAGATITSGQGSSSITVNVGSTDGYVSVTEIAADGCVNGPLDLFVSVSNANATNSIQKNELTIYYNSESLKIVCSEKIKAISLVSINGIILENEVIENINEKEFLINNSLPPGLYIAKIETEQTKKNHKIMIY